ncbi:glycosyltransferase family 2 protein [Candidatus Nanohalococcus occultus]|uniref:glycosyltransferase family 2 protein n=1 Tax=Candidatus Nanohalococcus occultus TaxID=2978047 RepID=UPI0039E097C9
MASVVIPTKDEEKIFEAIEKAKEENPDEIIVVDEESSQRQYQEKLRSLEGIKYLTVSGGTAKARNKGIEEAENDKVLLLDADCYPTEKWHDKMSKALDQTDLAEGEVKYIGERCPLNKIVENRGEGNRFLTANLGLRKEVFEDVKFDENYDIFREDTDFGWSALQKGFTSQFVKGAMVEHDAGRYNLKGFVKDRLRYKTEDYFYNKFKDYELIDSEVSKIGPIYYPIEAGMTGALIATIIAAFISPYSLIGTAGIMAFLSTYYTKTKADSKNARFCVKDWIKGLYYIPLGIVAKQYAVNRGRIR